MLFIVGIVLLLILPPPESPKMWDEDMELNSEPNSYFKGKIPIPDNLRDSIWGVKR